MIKNTLLAALCVFSLNSFACGSALPTNDVNFCASFKAEASCYCKVSFGQPAGICDNMKQLYSVMVSTYKTLQKACSAQSYTSQQNCMDNWKCYMQGGYDSTGKACSSTQLPCA